MRRAETQTPYFRDAGERVEDFTGARCLARVRAALGTDALPIKILDMQETHDPAWKIGAVLPSAEAIDVWMRGGEFAANPIGIVFDPEALKPGRRRSRSP